MQPHAGRQIARGLHNIVAYMRYAHVHMQPFDCIGSTAPSESPSENILADHAVRGAGAPFEVSKRRAVVPLLCASIALLAAQTGFNGATCASAAALLLPFAARSAARE